MSAAAGFVPSRVRRWGAGRRRSDATREVKLAYRIGDGFAPPLDVGPGQPLQHLILVRRLHAAQNAAIPSSTAALARVDLKSGRSAVRSWP